MSAQALPTSHQSRACRAETSGEGRFYSTTTLNRNVRNTLKTNDRCTFYSTINRGVSELKSAVFQPPASSIEPLQVDTRCHLRAPYLAQNTRPAQIRSTQRFEAVLPLVAQTLLPALRPAAGGSNVSVLLRDQRYNTQPQARTNPHELNRTTSPRRSEPTNRHTMQSKFRSISLKTNESDPNKVTHKIGSFFRACTCSWLGRSRCPAGKIPDTSDRGHP